MFEHTVEPIRFSDPMDLAEGAKERLSYYEGQNYELVSTQVVQDVLLMFFKRSILASTPETSPNPFMEMLNDATIPNR